jgi:uncharacterized protein (TIGR03435 family)
MSDRVFSKCSFGKELLFAAAVFTAAVLDVTSAPVQQAQSQQMQNPPKFEAAVIKLTDPQSPVAGGTRFASNRFTATGSVQALVQLAYGVQEFQISGGPKWLNSDKFNIDARPERTADRAEMKRMLQALLADRFKVVLHTETREIPVYALLRAKNGVKVQKVKDGTTSMTSGRGRLSGKMSMSDFARALVPTLGRTVLDRTGIAGVFEIKLEWMPDEAVPTVSDASGPSLFTALQEQLGLRLQSTKGPVEVLVIDHAEKPSEN